MLDYVVPFIEFHLKSAISRINPFWDALCHFFKSKVTNDASYCEKVSLSLMDIKKYIMVSKNHIFSVQHIRYMSKLSIANSTIITWGSFFYCKLKQHVIENIGIYFQCICYRKTVISDCGKVIYIHGKKCLQINIFITNLRKHCPLGYWTDILIASFIGGFEVIQFFSSFSESKYILA